MSTFENEYTPNDIVYGLEVSAGVENITSDIECELLDFAYWLLAAAQNEYNADYFRTAYRAFEAICERVDGGEIRP